MALAAVTDIDFKEAATIKEFLADPEKFAAAAAAAAPASSEAPAAADAAAAAAPAKEESEEEDDDMGFGLLCLSVYLLRIFMLPKNVVRWNVYEMKYNKLFD